MWGGGGGEGEGGVMRQGALVRCCLVRVYITRIVSLLLLLFCRRRRFG